MLDSLTRLLFPTQYIPHGHCYLWQPNLVGLHIAGDVLTALAYYSIPLLLLYFVRKRQDIPFQGIFFLFSAFILTCGTTHLIEVWTLWQPVYWISGTVKLLTATISLYTAVQLVDLIPKALALPSPAQLEAANQALMREIQERQQVEQTLRESEHRFRTLLHELRIGVVVQNSSLEITVSNPAAHQILGLNETQLLGKTANDQDWDVIHDDGTPFSSDTYPAVQVLATGQPVRNVVMGIYRPQQRDRAWLLVDAEPQFNTQNQLQQVICSFSDITERRQIEEERQQYTAQLQTNLKFEAMLKRVTDKVRDSLDEHQILQTAVAELATVLSIDLCRITFYGAAEQAALACYEYQTALAVCAAQPIFDEDLSEIVAAQAHQPVQFCAFSNPFHPEPMTVLISPITDGQQLRGHLWLLKPADIPFAETELRLVQQVANQCAIAIRQARLYQASQAQVKELERLNQLKDDFLSTVSHELRTPVSNMKMAIHMLRTAPETERRQKYLEILQTECIREIELINGLLDLQRLEAQAYALEPNPLDLQQQLPKLLTPFMARFEENQQIFQYAIAPNLPPFTSDPASIDRILVELLNNACKYTNPNGMIQLEVCPQQPVGSRQNIDSITSSIQFVLRNQAEIPATELPHIFEKFYRVPHNDPWKQGGTGLGLALVQKLVEHLNGSIQVESKAGWTTFSIVLPSLFASPTLHLTHVG